MFARRCFVVVMASLFTSACPVRGADPGKLGPYLVGIKTEICVDESRIDPITNEPRKLVTSVWYPAAAGTNRQKPIKFASFFLTKEGVTAAAAAMATFGGNFFKINREFFTLARKNAPIVRDKQFPLLIFSHGNGGLRQQNSFQCDFLATHGYVVVAPDHTGNAALSVHPDRVIPYDKVTRSPERRDDRAKDVSFLIDHFIENSKKKYHFLEDRLLPGKIGVFGHSFGGFTACRAAELDDRIRAILPMTVAVSSFDEDGTPTPCKVPSMVMLGDADRTMGEAGNKRSIAWYRAAAAPSYLLIFKKAGHFTFTEMNQLNPDFGDGVGVEKDENGKVTFQFSDPKVDKRIISRYSVAFFNRYLLGDTSAEKFLNENQFPDRLRYERHDGKKPGK